MMTYASLRLTSLAEMVARYERGYLSTDGIVAAALKIHAAATYRFARKCSFVLPRPSPRSRAHAIG